MLENIEFNDLIELNSNVKNGEFDFNLLLKNIIKEKEKEHKKYCSMCGGGLEPNSVTNYTIMFGPEGFKKKASFCALDCMEFFIARLKEVKKLRNENKSEEINIEN